MGNVCCTIEMKCLWKDINPISIFNKKPSEIWDFLFTEDDREWFWLENLYFIIVSFPKCAHASAVEQRARLSLQCWTKPAQAAAKQLYGPVCLQQKWSSVPQGSNPAACKRMTDIAKGVCVPLEAQGKACQAGPAPPGPPAARGQASPGL